METPRGRRGSYSRTATSLRSARMRTRFTTVILNPFAAAVYVVLFLPDRRARFELVYDVFAGIERLRAVRARNRDRNGDFADTQVAHAMNDGDLARSETLARFCGDALELRNGHRFVRF